MAQKTQKTPVKIETVPLPERPVPYEIRLPYDALQMLGDTVRFCVRLPWMLGIRIPSSLVDTGLLNRVGTATSLLLLPGSTQAIGTWPTPEQPLALEYSVSTKLLGALGKEVRIVVEEPWAIAATLPAALVRSELAKLLGKKDRVVLVP